MQEEVKRFQRVIAPIRDSCRWGTDRLTPPAAPPNGKSMTATIALVDDDRNILQSLSIALQAEGLCDARLFGWRSGAETADRQSPRPGGVRHQDAAHGRARAAAPPAREKPAAGDLPDQQGRRDRRGAGAGDGRRRLYRQAVFAAPGDRAHPGDPAPRRAESERARRRRRAGGRADHPRAAEHGPGAAQGRVGRQGCDA